MTKKVLFDVDPGVDDALALTTGLGHPSVSVVGVTTVAGNTTVANATTNARSVLTLAGRSDVPVASGCDRPLVDDLTTAEEVHGEGGLRGDLPSPTTGTASEHASEFILAAAREHGTDLTVVGLGPPTNLALALARDPTLPTRVDDVYLMGGAIRSPGNVTPAAEANFHNDPVAARRLVGDANPRIVGLDVTDDATVPRERLVQGASGDEPLSVVDEWLRYPTDSLDYRLDGAPVVHDAAVAADVAADVLQFERYACEVDTSAGSSRGALLADERGVTDRAPNARVATDIDVEAFRDVVVESTRRLLG